jgi:DNA-binding CsgD family transcriptional regulator
MKEINFDFIQRCIDSIYQCVDDQKHWQLVLESLADLVNGKGAILTAQNKTKNIDLLNIFDVKLYGYTPEDMVYYATEIIKIEDLWSDIEHKYSQFGKPCVCSNHIPVSELKKSEYYKKWLEPKNINDAVFIQIFKNEDFRVIFEILYHNSSKHIAELHKILKIITPHLCRAMSLYFEKHISKSVTHSQGRAVYLMEKFGLSEREIQVANFLSLMDSNKKVANALNISENTVKTHIKNIMQKFGVISKREMTLKLFSVVD